MLTTSMICETELVAAVFNFWEPLHYLDRGHGFQTWETSPVYAIRSWAYIMLHYVLVKLPTVLLGPEKVLLLHLLWGTACLTMIWSLCSALPSSLFESFWRSSPPTVKHSCTGLLQTR